MLYLGLDVHSKWMTVMGFNPETGDIVHHDRVPNDSESLQAIFSTLSGPLHGAMESGTNSWAVYRHLVPFFEQLVVVDPAEVWGKEVRRGAKTDKRDAMKLATKLSKGELSALYVPDEKTQDLRILVRSKVHATHHVTQLVNEIGSLLRSWGIIVGCSLLSKKGEKLIEDQKKHLAPHSLAVLEAWLEMLRQAQKTEATLEETIRQEAAVDEDCQKLMSIPGVGAFTAMVVRAEVGDIRRFPSAAHLVSYCGLSPTMRQSADKAASGPLNRFCNRYLRYAMVLRGAGACRMRGDNPLKKTYWRVSLKHHVHDAKIAVARQLVRVIYSLLKHGTQWDPLRLQQKTASVAGTG